MAYKFTRLFADNSVISSNGHRFRRLVRYPTTVGLAYELDSKGYYICRGMGSSTDSSVVIADTIDGVNVVEIGGSAFTNRTGITDVVIPDKIAKMGAGAFSNCSNLRTVTFEGHSSLTSVPKETFRECSSLERIDIPDNVKSIGDSAFYLCSNLAKVNIPNSVQSFGSSVFSGCSKLTSINIPYGVTAIPSHMLVECSSLTNIDVPDTVTSVGVSAFRKCAGITELTLPSSVTGIGKSAFAGCDSLESLTIPCVTTGSSPSLGNFFAPPDNGTTGTYNARYVPQSLKTVVITEGSMTYIDNVTFQDCKYIESITLPDTITQIGIQAFSGCTNLKSVVIGSGVKNILGSSVFYNCTSLESITVLSKTVEFTDSETTFPANATLYGYEGSTIQAYATQYGRKFLPLKDIMANGTCGNNVTWALNIDGNLTIDGTGKMTNYNQTSMPWYDYLNYVKTATVGSGVTSIGNRAFSKCVNLCAVTIPESVTSIGEYAFFQCHRLPEIDIPNSVTTIGKAAFYECKTAKSITLPYGLTTISPSAFTSCNRLEKITIPDSVKSIGDNAFEKCIHLTKVTIPESVESIGTSAFNGCSALTEVTILSDSVVISYESTTFPEGAAICGYAGSTAESYAKSFNRTFVPIEHSGDSSIGGTCGANGNNLTWSLTEDNELIISGTGKMATYTGSSHAPWYDSRNYIQRVTMENGVTSIGNYAFINCTSLTSITIPEDITSIGNYAFSSCSSLANPTIPDSVTNIGTSAFIGCKSLTSVTIPAGVTDIGLTAFANCTSLVGITVLSRTVTINSSPNTFPEGAIIYGYAGSTAEAYANTNSRTFVDLEAPAAAVVATGVCGENGDNVTWVLTEDNHLAISGTGNMQSYKLLDDTPWFSYAADSEGSHGYVHSIKTITIGEGVTNIGSCAFVGCHNLMSIAIPDSVTSIDFDAFNGCTSLKSITIPVGVMSIGRLAFSGSDNLEIITILSKTVEIYDDIDTIRHTTTIYGYAGSTAEAYATKYARTFVKLN